MIKFYPAMKPDIVVVGSIALDTIKTPESQVQDILGGSAVYFAWAASYFSKVGIAGVIGPDFPQEHIKLLNTRSINLDGLKAGDKTFRWTGEYGKNPDERKTLSVCQDVLENFNPELSEEYCSSDYVFLANINPKSHLKVLSQIKESKKLIAGDTMDLWIETEKTLLLKTLRRIDMMFLNESEARQLTNENNLIKAGRSIFSYGPKTVIIKKGENGVLALGKDILFSIPAYPQEIVRDATGAGDSFAGGVIGFLAQSGINEENLRKAVVIGSVIASFCVEDFGLSRLEKLTKEDIMRRVEKFRNLTRF
jgi:sugar/nucleoside kinase (ribokinase family)